MRSAALPLAAVLMAPLLLAGCNREPSFDERYARSEKALRQKAGEIDAELAERERQASEAAAALPSASATAGAFDQAASLMKAAK